MNTNNIGFEEYLEAAGVSTSLINSFMNEFEQVAPNATEEEVEKQALDLFNQGSKTVLIVRINPYTGVKTNFGFAPHKTVKKVAKNLKERFDGFYRKNLIVLADSYCKRVAAAEEENRILLEAARCSIVATTSAEIEAEVEATEEAVEVAKAVIETAEAEIETAETEIEKIDFSMEIEERQLDILADISISAGILCLERQAELETQKLSLRQKIELLKSDAKSARSSIKSLQNKVATLRREGASMEVVKCSQSTIEKFIRNKLLQPVSKPSKKQASRSRKSGRGITWELLEKIITEERAEAKKKFRFF